MVQSGPSANYYGLPQLGLPVFLWGRRFYGGHASMDGRTLDLWTNNHYHCLEWAYWDYYYYGASGQMLRDSRRVSEYLCTPEAFPRPPGTEESKSSV